MHIRFFNTTHIILHEYNTLIYICVYRPKYKCVHACIYVCIINIIIFDRFRGFDFGKH